MFVNYLSHNILVDKQTYLTYHLYMAEMGRPTIYTPELCDAICVKIADGKSLRTICADPQMPDMTTVIAWRRLYPAFSKQYDDAKSDCADAFAEDIIAIADDASGDYEERFDKDGNPYIALNKDNIQRSRLQVDARKWVASKLKPKKYGDALNVGGQEDNPLKVDESISVGDNERDLLKQFAAQLANKH